VDLDNALVLLLPLVASAPVQPPLALHPVALVDDQVSMADEPLSTETGLAVRVAVGIAGAGVEPEDPPPQAASPKAMQPTAGREIRMRDGELLFASSHCIAPE
jgi:hypothetical protein